MGTDESRERAIERAMRAGRSRRRRRRALAATAVVLALGLGLAASRPRDRSPQRTPWQTVDAFFAARAARDCEQLVDLVDEANWSDGGRRSRSEFLVQCEDALEDVEPPADPGRHVADTDGAVRREDGEWKVVTDHDVLTIGRSPEETVRGYVDAYDAGDCETMLDHLGPEVDRRGYLERCREEAAVRAASHEPRTKILRLEVSVDGGDTATASVAFRDNALDGDDVVTLRLEGLEWVLDENRTRPPRRPGPPFVQEHYIALRARLLDRIDGVADCGNATDHGVDGARDGEPGVLRLFVDCNVVLELLEVDSGAEAAMLARSLAAEVAGTPLPTVEELAAQRRRNRVPPAAPGELESHVATLRPNQWAPVPGHSAAHGVRTFCTVDGCAGTVATLPFGNYVVLVRMAEEPDLAVTAALLSLQTERL